MSDLERAARNVPRAVRITLGYLLWPFFSCWLHSYCLVSRYKNLRIGRCSFWGPPEFLDLCERSARELKVLDPDLFQRLSERRILFYRFSEGHNHIFCRKFSIADGFCSWKVHGIISRLVYVCFLTDQEAVCAFLTFDRTQTDEMVKTVNARTQFWLAKAGFSEGLISYFE